MGIPQTPDYNGAVQEGFDSSELQCWTEEARKTLKPKMVHEIVRESTNESASAVADVTPKVFSPAADGL